MIVKWMTWFVLDRNPNAIEPMRPGYPRIMQGMQVSLVDGINQRAVNWTRPQ